MIFLRTHQTTPFQSLIGILVSLNIFISERRAPLTVSIPNRDFSEFKQRASERLTVFSFQGAFALLLEIIAF